MGLKLVATNEYGESDYRALAMYGLDMMIEPFRETTIRVQQSSGEASQAQFHWLLVRADDDGVQLEDVEPVVDAILGGSVTVELFDPGKSYLLVVRQLVDDRGIVAAEGRATVACKYVRRELRSLTEADRTAFFEAMRVLYTIPQAEGRRKYGPAFNNYQRLTAFHNSQVKYQCGRRLR